MNDIMILNYLYLNENGEYVKTLDDTQSSPSFSNNLSGWIVKKDETPLQIKLPRSLPIKGLSIQFKNNNIQRYYDNVDGGGWILVRRVYRPGNPNTLSNWHPANDNAMLTESYDDKFPKIKYYKDRDDSIRDSQYHPQYPGTFSVNAKDYIGTDFNEILFTTGEEKWYQYVIIRMPPDSIRRQYWTDKNYLSIGTSDASKIILRYVHVFADEKCKDRIYPYHATFYTNNIPYDSGHSSYYAHNTINYHVPRTNYKYLAHSHRRDNDNTYFMIKCPVNKKIKKVIVEPYYYHGTNSHTENILRTQLQVGVSNTDIGADYLFKNNSKQNILHEDHFLHDYMYSPEEYLHYPGSTTATQNIDDYNANSVKEAMESNKYSYIVSSFYSNKSNYRQPMIRHTTEQYIGWAPSKTKINNYSKEVIENNWIILNLKEKRLVRSIVTQNYDRTNNWLPRYDLYYKVDDSSDWVQENQNGPIFGNSRDIPTRVYRLNKPIECKYIMVRIRLGESSSPEMNYLDEIHMRLGVIIKKN